MTRRIATGLLLLATLAGWAADSAAQTVKHYRFAYDQPKNTGYGLAGDIFANKLAELSKNTMLIDQYPGAQLGQEPQVLQLVKAGDLDFCLSSSANAATLSPIGRDVAAFPVQVGRSFEESARRSAADGRVQKDDR
jgi:TRAP-type transport system periplasmic protein